MLQWDEWKWVPKHAGQRCCNDRPFWRWGVTETWNDRRQCADRDLSGLPSIPGWTWSDTGEATASARGKLIWIGEFAWPIRRYLHIPLEEASDPELWMEIHHGGSENAMDDNENRERNAGSGESGWELQWVNMISMKSFTFCRRVQLWVNLISQCSWEKTRFT